MLKFTFILFAILVGSATCHHHHHSDIVYVDHLLDKYSKNGHDQATLSYNNVVNYVDNYLDLVASIKSSPSSSWSSCLVESLNEFKSKLMTARNKNNDSNGEIIQLDQFLKLNTFLVANLDRCYLQNETFRTFDSQHLINDTSSSLSKKRTKSMFALDIPKSTYVYAFLAIIVISVIGVLCVAVVPALNKCCFEYIFQFLTALALGTLCSDALLHLIPHTFVKHGHLEKHADDEFDLILMSKYDDHHESDESRHQDEHNSAILKGLAVLVGIYVFFLIETLLQICKSKDNNKAETTSSSRKYSKSSRDDSVESYDEFDELIVNNNTSTTLNTVGGRKSSDMSFYDNLESRQQIKMKPIGPKVNKSVKPPGRVKRQKIQTRSLQVKEPIIHSHSHSAAESSKTSLWMVIFGDCLHNLSDGLAIGASFTTSLTTGLGTTMAIFFHELPHEIGDFAVLRKNGVSTRNAVLFNLLSSVLSLIGCFIGLVIGSVETLSNWSFLIIAGTFIYISLVDLIPELHEYYKSSTNKKSGKFLVFGLQNLGILLGIGLMLAIAFYEQDIIKLIKRFSGV